MTKKKRIGLVGYFGWGNFGDELFLRAHHQHLNDEFELHVVHDLLESPYFSRDINEIAQEYDAFLIGGGDLINPVRVSRLYWQSAYLNKPTFIFGVGVPGAKFDRKDVLGVYQEFFRHPNCKLVVTRDPESYNWIMDRIGPTCRTDWYPDAVCAMRRPPAAPSDKKTLGVVMRSHRSMSEDLSQVRALADHARTLDYEVKHLVLATGSTREEDAKVARSIAKDDEEVIESDSLDDLCVAISRCSMLASIKFHGVVVAAMYGIPSVAMSVTPKNKNFLRQIGREEMLGGYTQQGIYKKLSYFPAPIHPLIRGKLYRDSQKGYAVLKEEIRKYLL